MKTRKLTSTDGFVLVDLEDAPMSVGVVRSAPKILQSGAEMLARSVTYSFATFGIEAGGASAGVNAQPDARAEAVAKMAAEVAGWGNVLLDAGKGVDPADLSALAAVDPRPAELKDVRDGLNGADELVAAGAIAAAEAVVGSLSGKRVAIEGFGPTGLALARQLEAAGAGVVAVAAGTGTVLAPDGLAAATLADAWAANGEAMTKQLEGTQKPGWALWGADADVVFAGSKAGAMTHEGAGNVKAAAVVPIGAVPITAKALAYLQRAGRVYVPDFVTLAGPLLAAFGGIDPLNAPGRIAEVVKEQSGHTNGLFLGCCEQAEAFLRTWRQNLPFGRPLA